MSAMNAFRRNFVIVAASLTLAGGATAQSPPAPPSPPAVVSIVPAQGEPEQPVTLFGSGFTQGTRAVLGHAEAPTRVTGGTQLEFEIPALPPGLYALHLRREDGTTSKGYNFSVLPPKPLISSLQPDTVYACATGAEREVRVSGRNFRQGSQVLLDGAALRTSFSSPESLTFIAPGVPGGLHQVQVKNPDETVSGIAGLFIEAKPEIWSVTQGEERVSDYDLIINGINFQQGSTVVVDGTPVQGYPGRDRAIVYDCTRIVYTRHPYDTTTKSLRLQVVAPGGGESQVVQVNAP